MPSAANDELHERREEGAAPFDPMDPEFRKKLAGLEEYLNGQLFGQGYAVAEFASTLRRAAMGVGVEHDRPQSFMLLLGPTGVGKTEICLRTSAYLFGTEAIARLNMAEFSDENAVLRVIGLGKAFPDDEGQLGVALKALEKDGGRMVLLDEIEKAHPKVAKLFLGMEAAEVTFGNGRKANLSQYHFIITSNLGTAKAAKMAAEGLPRDMVQKVLRSACEQFFNKEVVGRFTKLIIFDPLTRHVILKVAEKFISKVQKNILAHPGMKGATLILAPEVFNSLASEGMDVSMGARPMRHAAENRIGEACADYLIEHGPVAPGSRLVLMLASSMGLATADGRAKRGLVLVPEQALQSTPGDAAAGIDRRVYGVEIVAKAA